MKYAHLPVDGAVEDDGDLGGATHPEVECAHREVPRNERVAHLLANRRAAVVWPGIASHTREAEEIKLLNLEGSIPREEGHPVFRLSIWLSTRIVGVVDGTIRMVNRRSFTKGPVLTEFPVQVHWFVPSGTLVG